MLVMVGGGPWAFGLTHTLYLGLTLAGLGGLAVLAGIRMWLLARTEMLTLPAGLFLWGLFLGFALIHSWLSEAPAVARMDLLAFTALGLSYWMWHDVAARRGRWKLVIGVMLLSVSVMAWYAMIQHSRGSTMVLTMPRPEDYGMRASGAYACPNHFAHLLAMAIPFGLGLSMTRGVGLPLRLISGYAALVSLVPLYLSGSRSGWLGVFAGILVVCFGHAGKRGMRTLLVTAVVSPVALALVGYGLWLWSPLVQERIAPMMQGNVRLDLWADSLGMIQDRPWFGFGLGTYRYVYLMYQTKLVAYIDPEFAHNEYIHYAAELGLSGLVLMGLAVGAWGVVMTARLFRVDDSVSTGLLAGGLGVVTASLVHALFDFNFHIFANPLVMVAFMGVVSGVVATRSRRGATGVAGVEVPPNPQKRWLAGTLLLVMGIGQMVVATRITVSGELEIKARALRQGSNLREAYAALDRALAWDPSNRKAYLERGELARWQAFWIRIPEAREAVLAKAESSYSRMLELNPYDLDAVFGLAELAALRGDVDAEGRYLGELSRRHPMNLFFRGDYGRWLFAQGRYEEALTHLNASLAMQYNMELHHLANEARRRLSRPQL